MWRSPLPGSGSVDTNRSVFPISANWQVSALFGVIENSELVIAKKGLGDTHS